jgi:hypothetical protein
MKKIKIFTLVTILLASAVGGFSQYGEDEGKKGREALVGFGAYPCWYKDNQGEWYVVKVNGSWTDCPKVPYPSECETVAFHPIHGC